MHVARKPAQVQAPVVLGPRDGDHPAGAHLVTVQLVDGVPRRLLRREDTEGVAAGAARLVVVQHESELLDVPLLLQEGDQLVLEAVSGDPTQVDLSLSHSGRCGGGGSACGNGRIAVLHPSPPTGGVVQGVVLLEEDEGSEELLRGDPNLRWGGAGGEDGLGVEWESRGPIRVLIRVRRNAAAEAVGFRHV